MSDSPLSTWQARFFSERVCTQTSGREGVYFREQVFGALAVLSEALPDAQATLGEQNFRFFVREFLNEQQPQDALGTTLVEPFLSFLGARAELRGGGWSAVAVAPKSEDGIENESQEEQA